MLESVSVAKAELIEILPDGKTIGPKRVKVQFNPESLKVSFANQVVTPDNTNKPAKKAKDQRGTAPLQFVGKGSTKLSVQLWFDVTGELPQGKEGETDVRQLTKEVVYFITPKEAPDDATKLIPPGIRFLWGTFMFDGIVESMEESLEFFSPEGKPLRSSVTINLTQQSIQFAFNEAANARSGSSALPAPGTQPFTPAAAGSNVQNMAARSGQANNWQAIAQANGIENPRLLQPGQLIDLRAGIRFG
jgi:hypothetical protein